jgi:tetratricopeptide (TPR) repeat protein
VFVQRIAGGAVNRAPALFFLLLFAAGGAGAADDAWLEAYRKGVAEREAGRCAEAAFYLLEALRANPAVGGAVKADAVTTVDYLPNLLLADCLCRMGDPTMARKYLAAAASAGEDRAPVGEGVKAAAEACLAKPTPPVRADDPREAILERVQDRCGLPDQADRTLYPWHYDYEASQAFMAEGMYDAGIQYLYRALQKKGEPEPKSRIYGMWFLDYYPYLLLAKAFLHTGSDACAQRALERSLQTEDLKGSPEAMQMREWIRRELEATAPPPTR